MTTPTTLTYEATQARAEDLRRAARRFGTTTAAAAAVRDSAPGDRRRGQARQLLDRARRLAPAR
jgi:hypothetical protein